MYQLLTCTHTEPHAGHPHSIVEKSRKEILALDWHGQRPPVVLAVHLAYNSGVREVAKLASQLPG